MIRYIMLELNKKERHTFIQGLFVEEKYRQNGVAKRLISEAENYSKSIGYIGIEADIQSYLFKFYNKLGFSISKRPTDTKYRISKSLEKNMEIKKDTDLDR